METGKRLIDAKALKVIFDERYDDAFMQSHTRPNIAFWEGYSAGVNWGRNTIADAPTVDAVVLPCKIGDKVYRIDKGNYHSNWKPFVQELTVTEISWKKEKYGDKDLGFAIIADGIRYKFTSIGKSVFLTRNEAEAKMDGDWNG